MLITFFCIRRLAPLRARVATSQASVRPHGAPIIPSHGIEEKIRSLVSEVGIQLRSELDRAWQTLFSPRPDLRGAVVTAAAQLEGETGLLTQIAAGRWGSRAWEEIQKRAAELHGRQDRPGPGAVTSGLKNPSLGELMSVLRIAGMLPD